MNKKECYVLICHYCTGDDGVMVYWKESDAYRTMIEDMENEIAYLQREGYEFVSAENFDSAELYVPDTDIYFDWHIVKTIIE